MPHVRKRQLSMLLLKRLRLWQVIGVVGARQTGKSFLLREIIAREFLSHYLTVDSLKTRIRAESAPRGSGQTTLCPLRFWDWASLKFSLLTVVLLVILILTGNAIADDLSHDTQEDTTKVNGRTNVATGESEQGLKAYFDAQGVGEIERTFLESFLTQNSQLTTLPTNPNQANDYRNACIKFLYSVQEQYPAGTNKRNAAKSICEMIQANYPYKNDGKQRRASGGSIEEAAAIDEKFQQDFAAYLKSKGIHFIYDKPPDSKKVLSPDREIIGYEDRTGITGYKGKVIPREGRNWDPHAERARVFQTFLRGYATELFKDEKRARNLDTDIQTLSSITPPPYILGVLEAIRQNARWSLRDSEWWQPRNSQGVFLPRDPLDVMRRHLKDPNGAARYHLRQ